MAAEEPPASTPVLPPPSAAVVDSPPKPPQSQLERNTKLFKMFLPFVPQILLKSTSHILSLSPQSSYWDLRTTVTVEFLRSYLNDPSRPPRSIEKSQSETTAKVKVAPDTWCARTSYQPCEWFNGEYLIHDAIVALGGASEAVLRVGTAELTGEWVASRATPPSTSPDAKETLTDKERYKKMLAEVPRDDVVILYLHGGGYVICDPHSHRAFVVKLAAAAGVRAFVPRYRLAPQSPFPGPLLDALISYMFLLYPPPGSMHAAVAPSKIVLAGDSAGGGLSLCLIQLLLEFQRSDVKVHWYGKEYSVPLPAGNTMLSSWCDVSRSFGKISGFENGSEDTCQVFDYLPSAESTAQTMWLPSEGWNDTLRKERGQTQFYAPDALIHNPLVSPILADSWNGAPPIWSSVGDECLRDQNLYFAHRLLEDGVKLRFEKYTSMPHVFQGMLLHLKVSERAWESAGVFIKHVVGIADAGEEIYRCERVHPKTMAIEAVPREELKVGGIEFDAVKEMVKKGVVAYQEYEAKAQKKGGMDPGAFVAKI